MKTTLSLSALILAITTFSSLNLKAQATDQSANVAVNIILTDAISIVLGSAPQTVDFSYPNALAYSVRQDVLMADHFTVISNKGYTIKVTGAGNFVGPAAATIDLNTVSVNVAATTPITNVSAAAVVPLVVAPGADIITGTATTSRSYNINYAIPLPSVANILGKAAGTYTTNVFYTVTQL